MSTRPTSKLVVGVLVGLAVALSAAAVAQGQDPAPQVPVATPAPVAAPAVVVAPVVPTAPAQNPGTLAAIEESVATAPAPVVPTAPVTIAVPSGSIVQPSGPAPYVVPPAGPGIFQGSEQTLREIAYLQTEVALNSKRKEHVESVKALEEAKRDLSDQLSGKTKDEASNAPGGAPAAGNGSAPSAPVAVAPIKPEPYVNSVYGYGGDMYAEIVLGQTKILATKGTILTDGSRVVSVSNAGVTLSSKGRTKRIPIRGAAGF